MKKFSSFKLYPGVYRYFLLSDRFFLLVLFAIILFQSFIVLHILSAQFLVEEPVPHGTLIEGSVESVHIKNPLYAQSTIEQDVASILHAALFTYDTQGDIQPELAVSHGTLDTSQEIYTFAIRDDAFFHDGTPVTTEDIMYTIAMLEQYPLRSPYAEFWEGLTVIPVDDKTFTLELSENALYFPEALTTPILPAQVWEKIPPSKWQTASNRNIWVGAGPFVFRRQSVDFDERLTELHLQAFEGYVLGEPYLRDIRFKFFEKTQELLDALKQGEINAVHSVSPVAVQSLLDDTQGMLQLHSFGTGKLFGVFFNIADGHILTDPLLRGVMSQGIDRAAITDTILYGYAQTAQNPLAQDKAELPTPLTLEEAQQTLDDVGWTFNPSIGYRERNAQTLEVSFIYPDIEEVRHVAENISTVWQKLGISVQATPLAPDLLGQAMQRGAFDAVLYGYTAHAPKDLVGIWRASEQYNIAAITSFGTPLLNSFLSEFASYVPPERFLDLDEQPTQTKKHWHSRLYEEVREELLKRNPAIFLYSPDFLYIVNNDISGIEGVYTRTTADRFNDIHTWYTRKEKIWKFIADYLHS